MSDATERARAAAEAARQAADEARRLADEAARRAEELAAALAVEEQTERAADAEPAVVGSPATTGLEARLTPDAEPPTCGRPGSDTLPRRSRRPPGSGGRPAAGAAPPSGWDRPARTDAVDAIRAGYAFDGRRARARRAGERRGACPTCRSASRSA